MEKITITGTYRGSNPDSTMIGGKVFVRNIPNTTKVTQEEYFKLLSGVSAGWFTMSGDDFIKIRNTIPGQILDINEDISACPTIAEDTGFYTLNVSNAKNFTIITETPTAKTISIVGISETEGIVISVNIFVAFVNNAALTYPVTTYWPAAGAPVMAVGKEYLLNFRSYDNGTTWYARLVETWD